MTRPACAPFDVAVVLGAALDAEGGPSPALARRTRHGAALVIEGMAGHLLLSGGVVRPGRSEAEVMQMLAVGAGVSPARIVTETASVNTLENAGNRLAVIRRYGWERVVVVTDAYHLPRALYTFRRLGLKAAGAAVPCGPSALRQWPAWLREIAAFPRHVLRTERAAFSRRGA